MSSDKKGFSIPDPKNPSPKKYSFGDAANRINEVKNHKPNFAFDFVSLNKTDFCFNSKLINSKDYHKLVDGLKKISNKTYDEISKDNSFHFHEVDINDTTIPRSAFAKCLSTNSANSQEQPTVYQFKVFEKARMLGFIYNYVFYLVMFDRNHIAYKRK